MERNNCRPINRLMWKIKAFWNTIKLLLKQKLQSAVAYLFVLKCRYIFWSMIITAFFISFQDSDLLMKILMSNTITLLLRKCAIHTNVIVTLFHNRTSFYIQLHLKFHNFWKRQQTLTTLGAVLQQLTWSSGLDTHRQQFLALLILHFHPNQSSF